jgi:hypothetical protein
MSRKHEINKLIRQNIPGGNELLEAVTISDRLMMHIDGPLRDHAQDLHNKLREALAIMGRELKQRERNRAETK